VAALISAFSAVVVSDGGMSCLHAGGHTLPEREQIQKESIHLYLQA
jgi:hypothetical protein